MKKKYEKVLELTPITIQISEESAKAIARKWSHKGLDFLKDMWHKYYTNTHHLLIYEFLMRFGEKQLYLDKLDITLSKIKEVKEIEESK